MYFLQNNLITTEFDPTRRTLRARDEKNAAYTQLPENVRKYDKERNLFMTIQCRTAIYYIAFINNKNLRRFGI